VSRLLIGASLLLFCITGVYLFLLPNQPPARTHVWFTRLPDDHQPLVIAHQGGEGESPGNTMLAFRHAVTVGADVLDTDMQMSKDGVLVLMHDTTVDRTTNGKGAIRDLTLSQIKNLDAAFHYTNDGGRTFPYRGSGVTIPTVEELFEAFPDKRMGIEIKETGTNETAERFCALIRVHRMQDRILVSSFGQTNMDAFRSKCPEVATSATAREVLQFLRWNLLGMARVIAPAFNCFQVPEKSGSRQVITPAFIDAARERHLPVLPWTINEEADMRRLIEMRLKGINTDYPSLLLRLLAEKRAL
jgi:glycerophosphoryl diester phosphodiesterase